jgi:hypothetical protein
MSSHGHSFAAPCAAALALLLATAVPAAEVYRWTDADGKVHFGDKPPAGGADQINVRAGRSPVDSSRQQRTQRLLQEFEAERAERAASAAEQARADAERATACDEARNRHFEYQNSGYLYTWDENGEKHVLSDAQRRNARAEARADVDKWCD